MKKPLNEIERRRPVWLALSTLFLDTELDDHDFRYIARTLAESGYDDDELNAILHEEVVPVCIGNLMTPAGEWAMFQLEWLEEKILATVGQRPSPRLLFGGASSLSLIEREWRMVREWLPQARHISGNPFRPYPVPKQWPMTVVQLAEAVSVSEDCGFVLHDALVEAGHPILADHFLQQQFHREGCWVLRMILDKNRLL